MFGRFICFSFLKNGKCEDPTCTRNHVNDISTLSAGGSSLIEAKKVIRDLPKSKDFRPSTAVSTKMEETKKAVEEHSVEYFSGVKLRAGALSKTDYEMKKKKE